jgi:MoaE-MoaD fusion protein
MVLRIRLFAQLRERAGAEWIDAAVADDATVADALAELSSGPLGDLLARLPVRMAVNRELVDAGTRLNAGDELALLPPVSGGAAPHVRVTEHPIAASLVTDLVRRSGAGAIVTFEGTVRDVEFLHYEAYREMAEAAMATIAAECVERHGLLAAAAEHRVGRVALREPGVVVAVSAAHREAAFAGARELIDRIKAQAPIWKQELDGDTARWVAGEPLDAAWSLDLLGPADASSASSPTTP